MSFVDGEAIGEDDDSGDLSEDYDSDSVTGIFASDQENEPNPAIGIHIAMNESAESGSDSDLEPLANKAKREHKKKLQWKNLRKKNAKAPAAVAVAMGTDSNAGTVSACGGDAPSEDDSGEDASPVRMCLRRRARAGICDDAHGDHHSAGVGDDECARVDDHGPG